MDLSNYLEGKKRIYRSSAERKEYKDSLKGGNLRDTWFWKGGNTSTLTVPATPGGILADLKKGRQPEGTKVKIPEDGGVSSSMGLMKSNQFEISLVELAVIWFSRCPV